MSEAPALSASYAEASVLTAYSDDAGAGLFLRLARFPAKSEAWLWVDVFSGEDHFSLSERLPLTGYVGATDVAAPRAEYAIEEPPVRFTRDSAPGSPITVRLAARMLCNPGAHPTGGPGREPVAVDAEFTASHNPGSPLAGRLEVFGDVTARIGFNGRVTGFGGRGKWHEQTGDRPAFARAFTYLHAQGEKLSLLATVMPGVSWGFAVRDGVLSPVVEAEIAPPGVNREFRIGLADGSTVSGVAIRRHESTVPIEGKTWRGTVVVAASTEGTLVGAINDWQPGA